MASAAGDPIIIVRKNCDGSVELERDDMELVLAMFQYRDLREILLNGVICGEQDKG